MAVAESHRALTASERQARQGGAWRKSLPPAAYRSNDMITEDSEAFRAAQAAFHGGTLQSGWENFMADSLCAALNAAAPHIRADLEARITKLEAERDAALLTEECAQDVEAGCRADNDRLTARLAASERRITELTDGETMNDFICAILAGNNPRTDEPFATVARWVSRMHRNRVVACEWAEAAERREAQMREALEHLLHYAESQICAHDDTYRGGVLWTICRNCGRKWADDEGGFRPDKEPKVIVEARAALSTTPAPTPGE